MMRALVLSATHETKVNSSGTQVPLPLVDIHQENEPYLTTLVKRLSALAELEGITVVTNDAIKGALDRWAKSLPSLPVPARIRRICGQIECAAALHFKRADALLAELARGRETPALANPG